MLIFIVGLLVSGLVIGALGRLIIPGPNPMSIGMTILVGLGGACLSGLVGALLLDRTGGVLLAPIGAAVIVWWIDRSRTATYNRQG